MNNLAHSAGAEKTSVVSFGDYIDPAQRALVGSLASERPNPFRQLWDRGYRGLLPVVPPTGGIRSAGKRPGVLGPSGWSGRSAASFNATVEDLDVWHGWGASVGVRCWNGIGGIDIDTTNPILAARARELAINILGPAPVRYGRDPKGLLPYLMPLDIGYRQARFDDGVDPKKPGLVELLAGETKMFVAQGIHPGTGKPYTWPEGIWDYDALTRVTREQLDAYFDALAQEMPGWRSLTSSVDRATIDQQTLRGDPDRIRRAMSALPNDGRFGYPEWVNMAIALHGALPDDEALALELFEDWTDKATIEKPTEDAARVFRSVQGPFSLGASMIEDYATKHSGGAFTAADRYFDAEAAERAEKAPLFPDEASALAGAATYELLSIGDLLTRPDPVFMLARHIPEASLGFLYGDPGTGKSFIALDWALHIAFGRADWHGDEIRLPADASVVYIAAEGASGFKTRVRAWMKAHGIASDQPGRFGLIFQNVNFMQKEDVARLAATLRSRVAGRTCLLVVDTVSRAMPGADENLQKEMTLFVEACQSLQREFGAAVLGVHHANKSGDMRGSGVLKGAGDFVFKLERKSGAMIGALRCEKQKDAPDGWSENYRLDAVHVDEGQISLVPFRCEAPSAAGLTPDLADRVLDAIEAAWTNGAPWSASYRSKDRYAVNRMCREFDFAPDTAKELLAHWLGTGAVEDAEFRKKDHSKGLRVCRDRQNGSSETDNLSETEDDSVFD